MSIVQIQEIKISIGKEKRVNALLDIIIYLSFLVEGLPDLIYQLLSLIHIHCLPMCFMCMLAYHSAVSQQL